MEISSDSFLNQPPGAGGRRQKGAKTMAFADNRKQRPDSAATKVQKGQKTTNTTYKDWQVREETVRKSRLSASKSTAVASGSANTSQRMGASQRIAKKKGKSKSRSKSRGRTHSRGESADDIRRRVAEQFNFYMRQKIEDDDDDISLLADS